MWRDACVALQEKGTERGIEEALLPRFNHFARAM